MKNMKSVLAVILLLVVSLSCKLLNRGDSGGLSESAFSKLAASLPIYDPNAPPPSPGAAALRQLAILEPSAATLENKVEAVERAALKSLVAGLRAERPNSSGTTQATLTSERFEQKPAPVVALSSSAGPSSPTTALFFLQVKPEPGAASVHDAALIGGLISGLGGIFANSLTEKGGIKKDVTETKDGVTTTMNVELSKGRDDTNTFGFGIKTEGTTDGVAFKAEVDGKVDGQRCPNAEGQVSFTVKIKLGAQFGETAYTQELTAFVRAVVNDEAKISRQTIEVTQATRQAKAGRQVYVETGQTFSSEDGSDSASNFREIRVSQQATASDQHLSDNGLSAAYGAGATALLIAQERWRSGGCTSIVASSPGTVQPGSATEIPVMVRQKFDGSEVPSKLEASLSGGQSVAPTTLARTAGTLRYTAPSEAGKSATIKLIATSRRGRATLDLNANTGGSSYQIVGGLDDWQTNTAVCDIMKPFTLTGGGITMQVSGGLSGTYSYTGPFNANGTGTYTISLPEGVGKPGTMIGGGEGQVTGDRVYTGSGIEKYTLTPIAPCK